MSAQVNDMTPKRNLPSWMSSTSRDDGDKSGANKSGNDSINEEGHESRGRKRAKGNKSKAEETVSAYDSSAVGASNTDFSRLMEGVVFVLSGFVNPERSILRSQGLEMGAEYQLDWNSNCTLLVCAFQNTPKFRQVEAECGTIVSKEWIEECYSRKKLVEIDNYLMHAGKPWRKSNISQELVKDKKMTPPKKAQKQEEGLSWMKPDAVVPSEASEGGCSKPMVGDFSPSKVRKWAVNDLNRTILWLESQEEKPDSSDIKKVAVEGILTCLQDAIDLLNKKLDMQQLAEQWNFLPQVVEELVKSESNADGSGSVSKESLHKLAASCKKIYEHELNKILNESDAENKDMKTNKKGADRKEKAKCESAAGYDSDETIEMTQEEIDLAFKTIASEVLVRE